MPKVRACHQVASRATGHHAPHFKNREKADLARSIGPCVYVIRTADDLVKIGFTTNIKNRHSNFGRWQCILHVQQGTYAEEQLLHRRFSAYLARGREFYYPVQELLAWVNHQRELMGVSPISW